MRHSLYDAEHDDFRAMVRAWAEKTVVPFHAQWEKDGIVPREVWLSGGAQGLLGMDVEEEFGGGGVRDFRYNAVLDEEMTRIGASGVGFGLHNDVVAPYLLVHAISRSWHGRRTASRRQAVGSAPAAQRATLRKGYAS